MVARSFITLFLALGLSAPAAAIFTQTRDDLNMLADGIRNKLETSTLREYLVPMLLAPPIHHWEESRATFATEVRSTLLGVFDRPGEFIECQDCDTWRLYVPRDNRLTILNGEISLGEASRLKENPRYRAARSLATVAETPAGVEIRVVSLEDGRILYYSLADSTQTLDDVRPYHHFAQERLRREQQKALSYVFINLGIYPKPLFQIEFLEQWGRRNQHISGVGLSFIGPELGIGAAYHYMFPSIRKLHAGIALYYPLQNLVIDESDSDIAGGDTFVLQGTIQYNIAASYGIFIGANTGGTLSLGFNFYNPLFMPFLL